MQNQFIIQPYSVGKDKKSLAMILPSAVVKALDINPLTMFLVLRVNGIDDLHLRIVREDFTKKETKDMMPDEKFPRLPLQASLLGER